MHIKKKYLNRTHPLRHSQEQIQHTSEREGREQTKQQTSKTQSKHTQSKPQNMLQIETKLYYMYNYKYTERRKKRKKKIVYFITVQAA